MRVFVIGGNHHNTLGVIRSLGEKGINPYVIIQCNVHHPYIRKSRYISKSWLVGTDEEVLLILKNEGEHQCEKSVLIACSDSLSSLVDMYHDELSKWYCLPGAEEQGRITCLMDKEVMSQLAREVGFKVPQSIAMNTKDDIDITIPLPWIIKPLVSKNGKKADIKRIYSEKEWNEYCKAHNSLVQVQQLIDKNFEYQLIGLSLNGGEEVVIPGVSHVLRPAETTNTGFLHYEPLDSQYQKVLETGRKFLKATGYSGLFSLEFLRGNDGSDYFMEINFRNDGNGICVTASGVNLPYIWFLYNSGGDYLNEIEKSKVKKVYVMPEFADISLLVHHKLGLMTWLKDVRRTDRFMEYDKRDRAPFFQLLKETAKRGVKKIEHMEI